MLAVQQTALQAILRRLAQVPLEAKPLRAVLLYTCARWHKMASNDEQAIAELDAALELLPQLRPALQLMSRLQLARGDFRSAVVYLDEEIRCTRHAADACALYRERGRLLQQHYHDPNPTEQCYRAALQAVPDDWPALRSLSQHATIAGHIDTRIESLLDQRNRVDDPQVAACLLRELAGIYTRRAVDMPAAGAYLLEALSMTPRQASLLADITRLADHTQNPELLLEALERSTVPLGPITTQALARLFLLLQDHGDDTGLDLVGAYPRHRPNVLAGWLSYAELARQSGRLDRAVAGMGGALQALADSEPSAQARVVYRLARLLLEDADRPDEARRFLRRALTLDPDHLPARIALLRLDQSRHRFAELAQDFTEIARHLETLGEDDEEIADHYTAAAEAHVRASDFASARATLERALQIDPTFRPARDGLDQLLAHGADATALADLLADELELAPTDTRRVVVLGRLAWLDLAAGEPARALTRLGQLLKIDRRHAPALQCAAWIMERAGGHDAARRKLLTLELEHAMTPGRRSHLARLAAQLVEREDDDEEAERLWQRALDEVDDNLDALAALDRRYETTGATTSRYVLLGKRLLYTPCRATQIDCRIERANLLLADHRPPAEALAEIDAVLTHDSAHPVALYLAQHLTAVTGDWPRHLAIVEQRLALATKPRARAMLEFEMACTCRYHLGDPTGALDRLRRALDIDPSLVVVRQFLAERLLALGSLDDLAALVDPAALGDAGLGHTAALLEHLLQPPADGPSESDVAAQWSNAAKDGTLDDPIQAAEFYARLVAHAVDTPTRGALATCAAIAAGFALIPLPAEACPALANVADDTQLYDVLPTLAASPQLLDVLLETGFGQGHPRVVELTRNVEQALEAVSQSIVLRERLARRRPIAGANARMLADLEGDLRYVRLHAGQHIWAHRRLAELYRWRGDSAALIDTLRSWASQTEGAEAGIVHEALGEVLSTGRAHTPALTAFERAVAARPDDLACASRLARAYVSQGRRDDGLAVLARYTEKAEDADMLAAGLRELCFSELDALADAEIKARHVEHLDRLVRLEPYDSAAAFALIGHRRASSDVGARIDALGRITEQPSDAITVVALLVEYGQLLIESERDPDSGVRALRRALELAPGYTPALRVLDDALRNQDDHAARLELCTPAIDPVSHPAMVALRAAGLAHHQLRDAEQCRAQLWAAYEAAPDNRSCATELTHWLATHGEIERAYAHASAHDAPTGPAAAAHHEFILGTYAARLSDHAEVGWHYAVAALDHFRAALEHQPDHDLAFVHAERLCMDHGDRESLEHLLRSQLATRRGPSQIVALTRLARVMTDIPDKVDDVRAAYERAHKLAPDDPVLLFEFEHWARHIGDHALTAELLHERARRTSDRRYAAALYIEAAERWSAVAGLSSASRAAHAVLEALSLMPGDPHASRHLDRLLGDSLADVDVARALDARTTLRARSPAEQAIFCLESGELLERAGALDDARRAYTAAQTALPGLFVAEMGLRRLAGEDGPSRTPPPDRTPTNPTAVDDASLQELMDRAREAFMHLRHDASAVQAEIALAPLRAVLANEPNHPDALALTRAVSQRLADAGPAMQILADVFPRLEHDPVRHDIAVLLAEHFGPVESSIEYLRAALEAQPESTRALLALVQSHQRLGQIDLALEAAARMVRLLDASDPLALDDRITLARLLGEIPETRAQAFVHVEQLFDARPADQRVVALKAELCEQDGQLAEAADLYDKLAAKVRDPDRLHDILVRQVRLSVRAGSIDAQAEAAIERAAELQPGNMATLELLVHVLEATDHRSRLGGFLPQAHAALLSNIEQGALRTADLALLERMAQNVDPILAQAAALAHSAFDRSRPPPPGSGRVAAAKRLRRTLSGRDFESRLLASSEPAPIARLVAAADEALSHILDEFPVLSTHDATPVPTGAVPSRIQSVVNAWLDAAGIPKLTLLACETPNTALIVPRETSALHISRDLWQTGEASAWRGLSALAIARWLVAPHGVRALPAKQLAALLAACFAWAGVEHKIRDAGDETFVAHLVAQLDKQVPRRRKRSVIAACQGATRVPMSSASLARGTLATDLRLATLLTGRLEDCLAAAALLDGQAQGQLLPRVCRSQNARALLAYCLRADMAELRAQVLDET